MTIRHGAGLALCMTLVAPALDQMSSAGFQARLAAQENEPETTLAHQRNELSRLQRKLRELRTQAMESRKAQVERFQQDPDCSVFLVSLKAGGLGLNLTAASYVFLLDPWWNPAVEAQAIDRAHRIGQRSAVFAYRLIARDTVEEKILELQRRKRRVADAILAADASVMQALTVDDLDLLLS